MSDLHSTDESPQQYRAVCEDCGKPISDKKRMHSHLRSRHLDTAVKRYDEYSEGDFDDDTTYIQCNVCGTIRPIET